MLCALTKAGIFIGLIGLASGAQHLPPHAVRLSKGFTVRDGSGTRAWKVPGGVYERVTKDTYLAWRAMDEQLSFSSTSSIEFYINERQDARLEVPRMTKAYITVERLEYRDTHRLKARLFVVGFNNDEPLRFGTPITERVVKFNDYRSEDGGHALFEIAKSCLKGKELLEEGIRDTAFQMTEELPYGDSFKEFLSGGDDSEPLRLHGLNAEAVTFDVDAKVEIPESYQFQFDGDNVVEHRSRYGKILRRIPGNADGWMTKWEVQFTTPGEVDRAVSINDFTGISEEHYETRYELENTGDFQRILYQGMDLLQAGKRFLSASAERIFGSAAEDNAIRRRRLLEAEHQDRLRLDREYLAKMNAQ